MHSIVLYRLNNIDKCLFLSLFLSQCHASFIYFYHMVCGSRLSKSETNFSRNEINSLLIEQNWDQTEHWLSNIIFIFASERWYLDLISYFYWSHTFDENNLFNICIITEKFYDFKIHLKIFEFKLRINLKNGQVEIILPISL